MRQNLPKNKAFVLLDIFMMKFKKFIQNNFGRFPVRKMPDIFELDDIRLQGHDLAEPCHQMPAGDFIFETVNHPERLPHSLQSADPAGAVFGAFGHVSNQFMRDSFAVVIFEKRREIFQFFGARLSLRAKDGSETFFENRVRHQFSEKKPGAADENFLR
jgi:hypothetical protein